MDVVRWWELKSILASRFLTSASRFAGLVLASFALSSCGALSDDEFKMTLPSVTDGTPQATVTLTSQSVSESAGAVSVGVTLSLSSTSAITIPYTVAGTANGADSNLVAGTLTIAAGLTTENIAFSITNDGTTEASETIIVTLGTPTGAALGTSIIHTLTILDDDVAAATPAVTFALNQSTVSEGLAGGVANISVTLNTASASTVTVPFSVSGLSTVNGADYTLASSSVVFAPGATSQTLPVTIINDTLNEADERLILTFGAPTNATLGAIVWHELTVQNNDPVPQLSVSDVTVDEDDGTASFSVSLSAASGQAVTFDWSTIAGSAVGGNDFFLASGSSVTIPAGSLSSSAVVSLVNDPYDENAETFSFKISNPSSGATLLDDVGLASITDDDAPPTVTFSQATSSGSENAGTAQIMIMLSEVSGRAVTVPYTVHASSTAATPADFTIATSQAVIAAGASSAIISVNLNNDSDVEGAETIRVDFGTLVNADPGTFVSHTLTISDDDSGGGGGGGGGGGPLGISIADASIAEGGALTFVVALTTPATSVVTFNFSTINGSATSGDSDYTPVAGGAGSIAIGQTNTTLQVNTTGDTKYESNETLIVALSNVVNAQIYSAGTDDIAVGTITNDDSAPSLFIGDLTVAEGAAPAVLVTLGAASGQDVSVNYATSSGTATSGSDFVSQVGSILISAGTTVGTINLSTIQDAIGEPTETFTVTLTGASGGTIADATAQVSITDDEPVDGTAPTVLSVSSTKPNGSYSSGAAITVTVQFSEIVNVTGTPTLTLETGTVDQVINYSGGTGSDTLSFNYVVQAADNSGDLEYKGVNALALAGGTIADVYGNAGVLTLPLQGMPGSLSANKALVIDNAPPANFNIAGATSAVDLIADVYLTFGNIVTASWATATGASVYQVGIKNAADTIYVCPAQYTASTSYQFSGCTLNEGSSYRIVVTAYDALGNSIDADNNSFLFTVDTVGPVGFNIAGITGGTDLTADAVLISGSTATVTWADATDENSYTVGIYLMDAVTVVCAPVVKAANSTTHTFTGCPVADGQSYKVRLSATDVAGHITQSANSPYTFTVDAMGPQVFSITGITGGGDVTVDATLTGTSATVNWTDSADEDYYQVTIFANDGTTVVCAPATVAMNSTSYNFAACSLSEDMDFKARVVAFDSLGRSTPAANSLFTFRANAVTVNTGTLAITGVTGGATDLTADAEMRDGQDVVVNWSDAGGEDSYDVYILKNDALTVACPTVNKAANVTSHAFVGCKLDLNDIYRIYVIAKDQVGATFAAPNNGFAFTVKSGLYLSGTGGSYLNGVAITACGGTSTCNSVNPYVLSTAFTGYRVRMVNTAYLQSTAWTTGGPYAGNGILEVNATDFYLESGSVIDMNTRGYLPDTGPSKGAGVASNSGGGGGNGGGGGISYHAKAGGVPLNSITAPTEPGSGGGSYTAVAARGGTGGGLIKIVATGELRLSGTIRANGGTGGISGNYTGGGGSGGSIFLTTNKLSGSGATLQAIGGYAGNDAYDGGGGGGGRIAVIYNTDEYIGGFSGVTYSVYGGWGYQDGASGTLYLKHNGTDTDGRLYLDNGVRDFRETPLIVSQNFDKVTTNNVNSALLIPAGLTMTHPPGALTFYLINAGTLVLPTNYTIGSTGILEWRKGDPLNFTTFTVNTGGRMYHATNTTTTLYSLDITATTMQISGTVEANGRGFQYDYGPGAGTGQIGGAGGGGGYGGNGGQSYHGRAGGGALGSITNPSGLGSGGGSRDTGCGFGGYGGGWIKLNVTGNLELNGIVSANGGGGIVCGNDAGGGGSGGTVHITTNSISGIGGSLRVIGGDGGNDAYDGGGGSGGRVGLYYTTDNYSGGGVGQIVKLAYGGWGYNHGGAGTVFLKQSGVDTIGRLIIDNGPRSYHATTPLIISENFDSISTANNGVLEIPTTLTMTLPSTTLSFYLLNKGTMLLPAGNDLTIGTGGTLEWRKGTPISYTNLTVASGGLLFHSSNVSTIANQLDIQVTNLTVNGTIEANGRGYIHDFGPGKGEMNPSSSGGGGSYGGNGGRSYHANFGGTPNGTPQNPNDMGSGGGSRDGGCGYGGAGGGLININASSTFTLGGLISANGTGGSVCGNDGGGGGSGGGIKIVASTITAAGGTIRANGGDAGNDAYDGGGGSGGRIAMIYNTDSGVNSILKEAFGGWGYHDGAAGTIYLKHTGIDTNGRLYVNNGTRRYQSTTPLPNADLYDDVTTGNNGAIEIPVGGSWTLPNSTIDYLLVNSGTLLLPGGSTHLRIASGGTLEWRQGNAVIFNDFTLDAGGTLTHTGNWDAFNYLLNLQVTNLTLNGTVSLNGLGYGYDRGPGKGQMGASNASGGGSYGGTGGKSYYAKTGGTVYGTILNPNSIGSGGGSRDSGCGAGGYGGGLFMANVTGTFTFNGVINANGTGGSVCGNDGAGGGSGGGVKIVANTIVGSGGIIRTNGGSAGNDSYDGGGGGGGRIAVYYTNDGYAGTGVDSILFESFGGWGYHYGAAGTVYRMHQGVDTNGRLKIANNGASKNSTTPLVANQDFDDIWTPGNGVLEVPPLYTTTLPNNVIDYHIVVAGTAVMPASMIIASGGVLDWKKTAQLALTNLTIQTGGTLTHSANDTAMNYYLDLAVANNLTVETGAYIDANGKGFSAANGFGKGIARATVNDGGGGGSYGGAGSAAATGSNGGLTYGLSSNPIDIGSGGADADCSGGSGGGLIHISVGSTFTLSGEVRANGASGANCGLDQGGGGSGGGIKIVTNVIAGTTGAIRANGGYAYSEGGAGGGGRVKFDYTTDSYLGTITNLTREVVGGTNSVTPVRNGAAGTFITTP